MPEITAAMLRHAAMNLLAQREYSRKELFRKLGHLSQDSELIDEVLNWLERDRLLSDDRFVEGFVRSRIQKGHGPMRISQDLRQKGVASEVISLALEAAEVDWYELAENTRKKKFGEVSPSDAKEKARQIRFLQYRGFPAGVVMALF